MPALQLCFPVTGYPADRLSYLVWAIATFVADPRIRVFRIGRSGDLDDALQRNGSDCIQPVYQTASDLHAWQVEGALLRTFCTHPKICNTACDARGPGTSNPVRCVYVAYWCW